MHEPDCKSPADAAYFAARGDRNPAERQDPGRRTSPRRLDRRNDLVSGTGNFQNAIARGAKSSGVRKRGSDEDIAALQTQHEAMVQHYRNERRHDYFDANQAIHRRIAELTGNQTLLATYVSFTGKIRRARYLANISVARWSESVNEHEAFMKALQRRDAAEFGRLLQEHSRNTGLSVCRELGVMNVSSHRK
jgi:hypothetical protein